MRVLPLLVTLGCPWALRGLPGVCLHLGALDCQSRKRLWEAFLPELDGDEDSGREVPRPPDLPARRRHLLGGGCGWGKGDPGPLDWQGWGLQGAQWWTGNLLLGGHGEGSVVKGTGPQYLGADTGPEGGCPRGLEQEGVGMEYPQSS